MSAVDEYRELVGEGPWGHDDGPIQKALDAIAELEAEVRKWKADFRAMETVALDHEAELAALRQLLADSRAMHGAAEDDVERLREENASLLRRWEESEVDRKELLAELAALKGRRCETCKKFGICEVNRVLWSEFHEVEIACNRWAERGPG